MNNPAIFPWQDEIWQSLWLRRRQDRMPHALLFSGAEGLGKMQFALQLAAALLCTNPNDRGQACGVCKSCKLFAVQSHPDLLQIVPEEKSHTIKIDQIRDVVNSASETALLGGYRIIIVNPASAMNTNAANALLKTLEEPTAKTLLILICNESRRIPATIASRCQRIEFHPPATQVALQWLQTQHPTANVDFALMLSLANGAPLRAQEFLDNDILTLRNELYQGLFELSQLRADPLQKAVAWQEQNLERVLYWLLLWLKDILRCKTTEGQASLVNTDRQKELVNVAQRISFASLLQYIEQVQTTYARTLGTLNLNRQLLLEEILIEWKLCF